MAKKKKDAWLDALVQKSVEASNPNYAQNVRQQVDSGAIAPIKTTVKKTVKNANNTNTNQLAPIQTTTKAKNYLTTNSDGYTDTGKTLGQYSKVDYNNRKDWKVYQKDNNFYFFNERTKKYELITNNTNNEMKSADSIKSTKKTTKKTEENKNPLAPIKNQTNIANNTFSEKAKGATNKVINKKDPLDQLNTENRLKLDTSGLEGQDYNKYAGQLLAEQEQQKAKYRSGADNFKERLSSTAKTTAYLLNKGLSESAESIVDAGATAGAWVTNKLGDKKTSKKLQNYVKEDRTAKVINSLDNEMELAKAENNTIVKRDNIAGKVVEAIGGQIPNLALGAAGGLTTAGSVASKILSGANWATVGLRGAGSGAQEALMADANIDDATKYAILSGAVEVSTEWLTGGIPGVKGSAGSGIDKIVAKGLGEESLEQASKSLAHSLIKAGYRMAGEGGEEALAEILNPLIKNATYSQGEKIDWQQVGESAIIGAIVGGVLNAPVSIMDTSNAIQNQNKTNNAEKIINTLLENTEQKETTTTNAEEITTTETEQTPTDTDTIENDITDLQSTIEHLQERKASITEAKAREQLDNQIADMQNQLAKLQETQEAQFEQMAEMNNLDPNKYGTLKNAYTLLNKRGVQVKIDANEFADTNTNAFWSIDDNGKRQVVFNPNANTGDLIQNVAVHELTHDLLSDDASYYMLDPDNINKYLSTKEGYQEAREDLERVYAKKYDPSSEEFRQLVDEEAVASVLGYKLGNQEFVNQLIGEQPTLARQIYNWVMDKVDSLRRMAGYENEAMYWRDVKKRFEKAYKMEYNSKNKKADKRLSVYSQNNKYKNKTLDSIVFKKAVDTGETNFTVRDANNYYIIENAVDGDYDIYKVYHIVGNEDFLNALDRLGDGYYANRNRKSNSGNSEETSDRLGFNSRNNANVEREETWTEFIDRILENSESRENNDQRFSVKGNRNSRGELDNSSFSYRGSHQIENAKSITKLDLDDIKNKIINIDGYLTKQATSDFNKLKKILNNPNETVKIYRAAPVNELNNGDWVTTDKSYAQNVADNNGGKVYTFEVNANQLYYPDNIKELPSLHRLSSFQYVKNTEKPTDSSDIRFSASKQPTKDNQGNTVNKNMQKFMEDSYARVDEKINNSLVMVYHTTTDAIPQFNEFNPVGTQYYRFGDQVVNYYTDSKDMSGSYASQDYKMADTKKLNSIEEAKKYLNHIGKLTGNDYSISKNNGLYIVSQDKQISKEAREFISKLAEKEKQQMLDNIYEDEKMKEIDPNYSRVFSWNYFDKALQDKYHKLTEKYVGTADTVAIQQEVMKYLESPVLLHEDSRLNGEVVGSYDTEEELLKNIKTDLQKQDWSKNTKLQYEGYVNITNPYIVDAEKRNWNQVIQQSNDFIDELEERVPDNIKNNLTRLYNESANKSAEARENYDAVEVVIRQGIDGYNSAVDEEIKKANRVVRKVGFEEIEQILNDTQNIGVNPWYNIAEALQDEGIIGSATKTFIIDEFKLPSQTKEWLQENYNKVIPVHKIQTTDVTKLANQLGRTTTLKDIYNKNAQNYEEFDKYRMPNSYFIEQISAEGADYLGNELEDMFETRAEIKGADVVGEEIAQAASVSFSKPELIRLWGTSKTTNDIVKEIIASNKDGKTNYDGVIIKNVYDYGGRSAGETTPNNLYVTFNSNQFKAADNTNPTNDPDIRYSETGLTWQEFLEKNFKQEGTGQTLQDIKLQTEKAIAPLKKEITNLTKEVNKLNKQIAPVKEKKVEKKSIAPTTQEKAPTKKAEAVPVKEKITEDKDLFDTRDYESVGNKNINAYQYDNPEVKPYFQEMAEYMLNDLNNSIKGERIAVGDMSQFGDNDYEFAGVSRETTDDIAELLDGVDGKYKYSYEDIEKGLKAIIENHGAENKAVSKRIEFYLDQRLRNGYTAIDGTEIPANQEYIDTIRYSATSPQEEQIAPAKQPIREKTTENLEIEPEDTSKKVNLPKPPKTPKDNGEVAQILEEIPEKEDTGNDKVKNLVTKIVDKGYYIDKLARKTKNRELSAKYDYSLQSNGIANQVIGVGRYDLASGEKTGKSLYEVFEPVENAGLTKEFTNYLYHKHNIDRMSLDETHYEDNKPVFGASVTAKDSQKIVRDYETQYPEFLSWAQDVYDYNNANLDMLVKYGMLSEESKEYYNQKYPHYVPIIRNNDRVKVNYDILPGKHASVNTPVKKAKGGNQDMLPLKEAMAIRTMQTVNSSLRNNFGTELYKTLYGEYKPTNNEELDENIIEGFDEDIETITPSDRQNNATFSVYHDGEKTTMEISDEIYEALKTSTIPTSKLLNKLNSFRRGVITEYNPTFMFTNIIKDVQDGFINSKHATKFIRNLPRALKEVANKGEYYKRYIANGGSWETYFNYNQGTKVKLEENEEKAPVKAIKALPRAISKINEVIEMTPRMSEFISSLESGDSIETATYNAQEVTTNFKRGGDWTKIADRNGATFLNASMQGMTKQVRNIQDGHFARQAINLVVKAAIIGLAPQLLNQLLHGDDDDDYNNLSDYVKNNYYVLFKYGDGMFVRIPRGRVTSVIQEAFDDVFKAAKGEKIKTNDFFDLLKNQVLPSDPTESNLLSPLKNVLENKAWHGGTIVPTRLQNLPNAEQYDESTDSISKWLGEKLNASPKKISYMLDQYSGVIGDIILPYLTQKAESDSDTPVGKLLAPMKDKFTTDSVINSQLVSDIYDLSDELTKKKNSKNATDEDILRYKYVNSTVLDMSELYKEKREIQASDLKDSEKIEQVREKQREINDLVSTTLDTYNDVFIVGDRAFVGDKEYYLNKSGSWTKKRGS